MNPADSEPPPESPAPLASALPTVVPNPVPSPIPNPVSSAVDNAIPSPVPNPDRDVASNPAPGSGPKAAVPHAPVPHAFPTLRPLARPTTRSGRTVVTHPRTVATRVARDPMVLPDIEAPSGLSELALHTLMRAQLRMGLRYLAMIVGSLIAVPLLLANTTVFAKRFVFGVPVTWVLVGAGFFPLLLGVAISYSRSIARLESAYLHVLERP